MKFGVVMAAADLRRKPDPAIESADRLAGLTGANLHVLHCTTPAEDLHLTAEAITPLLPAGATLRVEEGEPAGLITAHSKRVDADLIVLGPRLARSPLAGLLGTTADRVIRTSGVPCLLTNAPLPESPTEIMVALDKSRPAREAFRLCGEIVQAMTKRDPRPVVVHLVTINAFALPGRLRTGLVNLQKYAQRLESRVENVVVSRTIFAAPLPAEGIVACVKSFKPDLLVMGTHGSGLLGRMVMGGVAKAVAEQAEVPLILVPPPGRRARPSK